ncbi:hypothetical protein LP421_06950 [Rhizobium sp. RCAM05350]|nr:hypothetical protein LP421_06950 [Rhizobium sp. RCAM05350]
MEEQCLLIKIAACWNRWGLGFVTGAHILNPYLFVAALLHETAAPYSFETGVYHRFSGTGVSPGRWLVPQAVILLKQESVFEGS